MKIFLRKRTYVIIAVLLLVAAMSIAATKPEEEQITEAFELDYEMEEFNMEV